MNRDDVIRMAQECHLIGMRPHLDGIYQDSLERFAALVAAAAKAEENEACAKLCESRMTGANELMDAVREMEAYAIRSRSIDLQARGNT